MRPSRRAAGLAWVLVAAVVGVQVHQVWPRHPDRAGFRSQVGVVR